MKKHVVIVSNLYPNRDEPNRGVFIRQLTERLKQDFHITVVCPVPWRPVWLQRLVGSRPLPNKNRISGIDVFYPKHIVIPKVLRFTYGWFMYLSLFPLLKKLHKKNPIDLISAHWVYPDGFGAVKVANRLKLPVTVHALGCDINEYSKYRLRRSQISNTLKKSTRVVVKSDDLSKRCIELGGNEKNIYTVHNGVDSNTFFKNSMSSARKKLGLYENESYLLFVGNIQEEKGLKYLISALSIGDKFYGKLLVVGTGPQELEMKILVSELGLSENIVFVGGVSHEKVPIYLNACDALCLPSLREGCPNIVLESLSCGTPVLASNVGAVPQIITKKQHGIIVPSESSVAISKALPELMQLKKNQPIEFNWYSWQENAEKIGSIFNDAILN